EMYLTEDGYFMYDSDLDVWIKYEDEFDFAELEELMQVQLDPQAQFELMNAFVDDLKVYELDNVYELQFSVSNAGFQELLDYVLNMPELGLEEGLDELGFEFNIEEMTIISTVDKETFFPLKDKVDTKITMSLEGEEIKIVQKLSGTY